MAHLQSDSKSGGLLERGREFLGGSGCFRLNFLAGDLPTSSLNLEDLFEGLSETRDCNEGLSVLYDLYVDRVGELVAHVGKLIDSPESINDTNRFASLLVELGREEFLAPLMAVIGRGVPGESKWLADFMYALIRLQEYEWEGEGRTEAGEDFVHLLGAWILSTGGGEISWKAATLLAQIGHPTSRAYFFQGAVDEDLFHLTRIECLRGVVNHFRDEADDLIAGLVGDQEPEVREAALAARGFLARKSQSEP